MSREYALYVEVYHPGSTSIQLKEDMNTRWCPKPWLVDWTLADPIGQCLCLNVQHTLYAGTSQEEFVKHLKEEIGRLFGQLADGIIRLTYLEDLPFDEYSIGEKSTT